MTEIELTELETETQAKARLQRARTRKALSVAGDAVAQLRTIVQHSDGRTEAGVDLKEQRTPLLATAVDAADRTYAVLMEWSAFWAVELGHPAPVTPFAWRLFSDGAPIAGFKPNTGSRAAKQSMSNLTVGLLIHMREMVEHPAEERFMEQVNETIWEAYAIAGQGKFRERDTEPAICPACGLEAVGVEFYGSNIRYANERGEDLAANVDGVDVRCAACGWTAGNKPSEIVKYLPWSAAENGDLPTGRRWVRVQMRRDIPWQTVPKALKVDRTTRFGNPYSMVDLGRAHAVDEFRRMMAHEPTRIANGYPSHSDIREALAGHDLACWCPADEPCHADVLLQIANT